MANPPIARFHNGLSYQELQHRQNLSCIVALTAGLALFVLGSVGQALHARGRYPWPQPLSKALMLTSLLPPLLLSSCISRWQNLTRYVEQGNNQWADEARQHGASRQAVWDALFTEVEAIRQSDQFQRHKDRTVWVIGQRCLELAQTTPPDNDAQWDQAAALVAMRGIDPLTAFNNLRWNGLSHTARLPRELALLHYLETRAQGIQRLNLVHLDRHIAMLYEAAYPDLTQALTAFCRDLATQSELDIDWNVRWPGQVFGLIHNHRPMADSIALNEAICPVEPLRVRHRLLHASLIRLVSSWSQQPLSRDPQIAQQLIQWAHDLPDERHPELIGLIDYRAPTRFVQCISALVTAATSTQDRRLLTTHLNRWFRNVFPAAQTPRLAAALHDDTFLATLGQLDPTLAEFVRRETVR